LPSTEGIFVLKPCQACLSKAEKRKWRERSDRQFV